MAMNSRQEDIAKAAPYFWVTKLSLDMSFGGDINNPSKVEFLTL